MQNIPVHFQYALKEFKFYFPEVEVDIEDFNEGKSVRFTFVTEGVKTSLNLPYYTSPSDRISLSKSKVLVDIYLKHRDKAELSHIRYNLNKGRHIILRHSAIDTKYDTIIEIFAASKQKIHFRTSTNFIEGVKTKVVNSWEEILTELSKFKWYNWYQAPIPSPLEGFSNEVTYEY